MAKPKVDDQCPRHVPHTLVYLSYGSTKMSLSAEGYARRVERIDKP